jgi:hypothetical protein
MRYQFQHPVVLLLTAALTPLLIAADPPATKRLTLLQLNIVEGEGGVHQAGTRSSEPLAIVATDELGRPVEGVAVSFRMPSEGPRGTFESGLPTEVLITGPDGRVVVRGIRWGRETGPARIRITAVRSGVRAGTISEQYVASGTITTGAIRAPNGPSVSKPRGKWIAIALVAAGAAVGGLVLGLSGKQSSPSLAVAAGQTTAPVQVGPPTITIGGP